jgi:hypothetical protein
MLDGGAGPIAAVCAHVEDVFRGKAEPLEQREKGIEAFAGPGTLVDANEAEAEFAQEGLNEAFHLSLRTHLFV